MATPEKEGKKPEVLDAESKGVKRPAPDSTCEEKESKVTSANEWEKVKLGGDDDRKNKFLRLMGAKKKEHHGRFVIGDNKEHGSKADTSGHLVENIEAQFNQGMEHKLKGGYRGHLGLGFSNEDSKDQNTDEAEQKSQDEAKSTDETKQEGSKDAEESEDKKEDSRSDEPDSSSSATTEKPAEPSAPQSKYNSMGFVKSSS